MAGVIGGKEARKEEEKEEERGVRILEGKKRKERNWEEEGREEVRERR